MFQPYTTFSGFSVKDLDAAREFYTQTLGLQLTDDSMGLDLQLPGGGRVFVYQKDDHQPATFTTLNFVVASIDEAVTELESRGVQFARYDNLPASQDEKGILRGLEAGYGPSIAWFKDPSGNTLAVLQEK